LITEKKDKMSRVICDWTTYKGSHCKKIIRGDIDDKKSLKFCDLHRDLIVEYLRIKDPEELCETFKEIKVVPRSYKHIKTIMSSLGNEDDAVQVYLSGGCIEEADISNDDYITLNSDNSRFYYSPKRGQNRAKDLKVILREYCQHISVIYHGETKYCEECYKKLKDVPRISLIT
jgi:hypothetical protein